MKRLKKKDINEGKELVALIESLPEEEKRQAVIYIGALSDRNMIQRGIEKVKEVV